MTAYQQSGIWAPHNPGQSGKASPADARRTNRSLIFSLLFPDVQLSRAELGRRTGLSRVAVSDVVNSMLSCHLLRENGRESNGGKGKRGMTTKEEDIIYHHFLIFHIYLLIIFLLNP